MELKCPTFSSLYLSIKLNSEITKVSNSFKLVDEFCAIHNLDPVTLKELCFYFGASEDKEFLTWVKSRISVKALIRPRGYNLNKLARS